MDGTFTVGATEPRGSGLRRRWRAAGRRGRRVRILFQRTALHIEQLPEWSGSDNNDYFGGTAAQIPSIDSIQEFEVQTNTFSAEYRQNTGSIINLVTKSGSNGLHGSVYEFFRNDVLDARNYFNNTQFPKSGLRLNRFGGTLGGPIVKNKTFFFLNYEGFRRRAGITRITNVPTLHAKEHAACSPTTTVTPLRSR